MKYPVRQPPYFQVNDSTNDVTRPLPEPAARTMKIPIPLATNSKLASEWIFHRSLTVCSARRRIGPLSPGRSSRSFHHPTCCTTVFFVRVGRLKETQPARPG